MGSLLAFFRILLENSVLVMVGGDEERATVKVDLDDLRWSARVIGITPVHADSDLLAGQRHLLGDERYLIDAYPFFRAFSTLMRY